MSSAAVVIGTCWANSLFPGLILHAFLSTAADILQNQLFRKILSGTPSECQTDWIQIRPDILLGLIWVQSVCQGYEQTTCLCMFYFREALASPGILNMTERVDWKVCSIDKRQEEILASDF